MPSSTLHLHRFSTATACKTPQQHPSLPHLVHLPVPDHIMDVPHRLSALHNHEVSPDQCSSKIFITIPASLPITWSLVRRFDRPQTYKRFLKNCTIIFGDGISIGSLREVLLVSGMPATTSIERLEVLDDENHVISFSIVGGDQRLENYRSVTTLHSTADGCGTVIVESYVVDVPTANTEEETCAFVDTIVRCNLESLARIVEKNASFPNIKYCNCKGVKG